MPYRVDVMKILIVYDSIFGHTAQIARAIALALKEANTVRLFTVQEARGVDLLDTDLLILGSPTRGFRPTPNMAEFAEGLDTVGTGKWAAVFDTRLDLDTIEPAPLRWVVEAGGYAASRLAAQLTRHGFAIRGEVTGFLVSGTEGPLKKGELERAADWAASLIA
jgi:flavodoxin